jgi:nitrite reductase/ring-hydroxylating ferredoxin subunit/Fe-S cluster biogenesis protein NfuA
MSDRPRKQIPVVQVASPTPELPAEFRHLLEWLGTGLERMEEIEDEKTREEVFALLEGIDVLHRQGLGRIFDLIGSLGGQQAVESISQDPIVGTLLEMYDLPEADERTQVERALEPVYPYFQSHGGKLDLLGVENGRVRVRLSGSCEGCPGTATTLQRVVEEALREGFPGFRELVAEEPPPAPKNIVQLGRRPLRRPRWVAAGRFEDLEPGVLRPLRLEEVPLILISLGGEVYAYRDGCPPGSALTLQLGRVEGTTLVCPWHGCRYDLRTGKRGDGGGKLPVLPVAVREGDVKVVLGVEEVEPD